jgi:hypothetical protein
MLFVIEIVVFDDTEESVDNAALSGNLDVPGISLHALLASGHVGSRP